MHNRYHLLWGLSVALSIISVIKVEAQLIPDNTLGKENSIVNSADLLQKIDGGAIRGSNLFHSFREFNIDNGKSVYFSNPNTIQNILTRVTGKNPSSIFGKLGVLGNANLFLINPNGIIFSQNSSLDISGSFTATTLPSSFFNDAFELSETNSQATTLLKINITPGLQYSRLQQGEISSKANLTVGRDLNLIGKNINLTGKLRAGRNLNLQAENNLEIRDYSEIPFIADAGNNLLLQGNETLDIFALNHPDSGLFSGNDLILQSANPVLGDAHYFSGGSFRIEQLNGNLGDLESPEDPIIRSSGDVSFDSYRGASLHILAGGNVNITGNITITDTDEKNGLEDTIALSNGETLEINGKIKPTLDIRAGTTTFGNPGITGNTKLKPDNPNTEGIVSSGDIFIGGNIEIKKKDGLVFLSNQYNSNPNLSRGNIQITGNINTSTGAGDGGDVVIDSVGNVDIINYIRTDSRYRIGANAGDVLINAAGNIRVSNDITANSLGNSGGRISLSSKDTLSIVEGAIVESESNRNNIGVNEVIGNDIKLSAPSILVEDNSQVLTILGGLGKAGDLIIDAEKVEINDGSILGSVTGQKFADSGDIIFINTDILNLNNDAEIITETSNGISGNIQLQDLNNLKLSGNSLISANTVNGQAGNININAADEIKIENKSRLVSRATDKGNSGSILIQANSANLSNEAKISVTTQSGTSGNIQLDNLKTLLVNDNSSISANTGDGKAGNIAVSVTDLLGIETNSKLASEAVDDGVAGNINIVTNQLNITDNSQVNVSSKGNGSAGSILVRANDVLLKNKAEIAAKTKELATDGNIIFDNLNTLELSNSLISVSTIDGKAGDIDINATDSIQLSDNSMIASEAKGNGIAGELRITTNQFTMTNSQTNVSSRNDGDSGDILINANDLNLFQNAKISATTESGEGGDIILNTKNNLSVNSSQISASTIDGTGGNLTINATESINLTGIGGLLVKAKNAGTAGYIEANTNQFNVLEKSEINVSSKSGQAGYLQITANDLFLNQGKLSAETGIGEGSRTGEITLNIQDFLTLENNSLISAKAFENANGGNITINNPQGFVIGLPFENSDIIANANKGNGGNIDITTQNILGLKFRQAITSQSDITASSKFGVSGQVTFNQLNIDPSFTLINLPSSLSQEAKIQPGCVASAGNDFVISGRGGLPQSPNGLFSGNAILVGLVDLIVAETATSDSSINSGNRSSITVDNQKNQIIEATGWIRDTDGNVIFVAKVPQTASQKSEVSSASCQNFVL
ncbi:MAG: filamentous hemagglutinin N-terminal domain-containing protein [Cyanobacteriota bacterium]|nr:filamentous hemagglutinin N-terminal domain-containing protein [Cyanobacteriota bacterium]